MRREGFTLTELMAVIGIIAMLLAVVMPSVSPIFALGRATICRNNLHHIGTAFPISAQARGEKASGFASMRDMAGVFPLAMSWPGVPGDAVTDSAVYQCPDDVTRRSQGEGMAKLGVPQ